MRKDLSYVSFTLGLSILMFIFLVVSLTSVVFLFGSAVSLQWLACSTILSIVFLYFLLSIKGVVRPWLWVGVFLSILSCSILFGLVTVDSSYDGNSYHKTAIGALKNGWNPVEEDINSFNSSVKNPQKIVDQQGLDRKNDEPWVNSYPKATWIFAANIYKATGSIESGKAINLLVIFAVFLLTFSYLGQRLRYQTGLMISILLALNPVTLSQLYGYFNDGLMGGLIIILIALSTILIDKKVTISIVHRIHILYIAIFITIAIVVNVKFTGLAYAGITMLCYWLFLLWLRDWRILLRVTGTGIIAVLFGILIIGSSSYVRNTFVHGNPLYPLVGENSVDIMTHNQPSSYSNKSGIRKFIEANLSQSGNISYANSLVTGDPKLKVPFTMSVDELNVLGNDPDLRQAGYGVWFGGILMLSAAVGLFLLIKYGRRYKQYLAILLLPLISVGLIALIFDNSWWARYLPHLYIFPVILVICSYLLKLKIVYRLMIFMLIFNTLITGLLSLDYQYKYAEAINNNISINLPCKDGQMVRVASVGYLSGAMYNLWDKCAHITPVLLTQDSFEARTSTRLITDIYRIDK